MNTQNHRLHSFQSVDDSAFTFENPKDDIRGFTVRDSAGEKIGKVDQLLVDPDARKVRFLQVGHGGFLGIGREHSLLPVDAIQSVDYENREVYINQTRERIGGSPAYQPDMVEKGQDYYATVYDYYGYPGPWSPGYVYPDYTTPRHDPIEADRQYDKSRGD
jgi:sporulation protein YlmC with PRC-barrel domain